MLIDLFRQCALGKTRGLLNGQRSTTRERLSRAPVSMVLWLRLRRRHSLLEQTRYPLIRAWPHSMFMNSRSEITLRSARWRWLPTMHVELFDFTSPPRTFLPLAWLLVTTLDKEVTHICSRRGKWSSLGIIRSITSGSVFPESSCAKLKKDTSEEAGYFRRSHFLPGMA